VLQEKGSSCRFQFRLFFKMLCYGGEQRKYGVILTFHAQINSSCFGGTVFVLGSSCSISNSSGLSEGSWSLSPVGTGGTSRIRGCGSSPKSCTAGIPFFSHRNLSVNRGPISWSATFSVDLNAYLHKAQRNEMWLTLSKMGNAPMSSEEQKIALIV